MNTKILFFNLLFLLTTFGVQAQNKLPDTDWFVKAKYGLFFHLLPDGPDFQKLVDQFNVESFVQDCSNAGAGYVFITLGQNSGYYILPNSVLDKYVGVKPGERCSKRDLPAELGKALNKKGIELMLYVTGGLPADDSISAKRLGAKGFTDGNWIYNETSVKLWAEVMQEWADRYGSLVSGWWVDGCYTSTGFTNEFGKIIIKALKHGNANSIVALNSGLNFDKVSDGQDYLAGEWNTLLGANCINRWKDGAQWHELSFLGKYWGTGKPSCTAQQLIDYLDNNINGNGGVLTVDIPFDPEFSGKYINQTHIELLKTVRFAIRGK